METVSELRRWLKELQPSAARLLVESNESLRNRTRLARSTPGRRAAVAIQSWAGRASQRELRAVAASGAVEASRLLAERGWSEESLAKPDEQQLTAMLTELEPPLAELALFGLLIEDFPASTIALRSRATLSAAAAAVPKTDSTGKDPVKPPADAVSAHVDTDDDLAAASLFIADAAEAEAQMLDAVNGSMDADLVAAIARHEEANIRLRDLLDELGIQWSAQMGLGYATALIEKEAARRQVDRRQTAQSEIAQLSNQRQVLSDALGRDLTPEAAKALEAKIAAIDSSLAALQPAEPLNAAEPQPVPIPEQDAFTAVSTTDSSTGSIRMTHLTDAPAATPNEPALPERALDNLHVPAAEPAPGSTDQPGDDTTSPTQHSDLGDGAAGIAAPLSRFIAGGRLDEAFFLVRAHEGSHAAADALAYAAAAFRCRDAAEATAVAAAFDADWQAARFRSDPLADTLTVVAAIRLGAVIGWAPAPLIGRTSVADSPWWELAEAASEVVRRGQTISVGPGGTAEDQAVRKAQLRAEAIQLIQELPMRTVKYERATNVLRHLVRPGDGVAGQVLQAVVEWIDGESEPDQLRAITTEFRSVAPIVLINQADRALSRTAKEPITSGALKRLERHLDEIALLAAAAVGIADAEERARPDDTVTARDLYRIRNHLDGQPAPARPEGAALGLLRDWLSTVPKTGTGLQDEEESEPLRPDTTPLLAARDLVRGLDGQPDLGAPGTVPALLDLLTEQDIAALVHHYNEQGDIGLSRALLAAASAGRVPAVTPPTARDAAELAKATATQEERWFRNCQDVYHQVGDLHARVWSMRSGPGSSGEESADDITARLEVLAGRPADRAYGRLHTQLVSISETLRARFEQNVDQLRADLAAAESKLSASDRGRIGALLDKRDVVAATELLILAGQEGRLPAAENDGGADLGEFVASTARGATPIEQNQEPESVLWFAQRAANGATLDDSVREALTNWDDLAKLPGQEQRLIPRVLRTLGLDDKRGSVSISNDRLPTGIRKFRVNCRPPHDGYVAAFGSSAPGAYTVFLIANPAAAANPAKVVADWVADEPTIVLCLRPIPPEGWRNLLARSRRQPHMALVVDPAVYGWVAARANQSFRALQRITLPWTGRNPYTPFAAGLVPPEVFHGRSREMEGIKDQFGPLFVYGGRQLGKSAMLHRVTDEFGHGVDTRIAVYIDLKAEGIGDVEAPERIWVALARALRPHGVIPQKTSDNAGADVIAEQVRRWLQADAARRLLVLADESDAFMTADHRDSPPFRTVDKIKGLIEDTNRRFKIVFAGLHQVQRFVHLSNVPLAHGGEPIRIGPLDAAAARRLVIEPLAAVGYVFDDDDRLVWRILAHTNCQASLIQIFCDQLVRELAEQGGEQLPITVTDAAVDRTAAVVRPVIAQRLRFTINLQDRYRVLMLILALRSVKDRYSRSYGLREILSEAKRYWDDGFRHTTTADLQITLEEMIGLGVVVGHGNGEYGVRSPNLVAMLGTPEQLELELTETSFDSPYEYDPNVARRSLSTSGIKEFSPLTERQLARVVRPGRALVAATKEQGGDRLQAALRSFAEGRNLEFEWCELSRLPDRLTEFARRGRQPIVGIDGRGAEPSALAEAISQMSSYASPKGKLAERTALMLVEPRQARQTELKELAVIRPLRWTAESLRSWPDCPATDAAERKLVIEATGGWSDHVEQVIDDAESGTPLAGVVEDWVRKTSTPDVARDHLARSGVDRHVFQALSTWVAYLDRPEQIPEADLESVLDEGASVIEVMDELGLLDRDESGVSLNPATFRAVAVLGREQ